MWVKLVWFIYVDYKVFEVVVVNIWYELIEYEYVGYKCKELYIMGSKLVCMKIICWFVFINLCILNMFFVIFEFLVDGMKRRIIINKY